MWLYITRNLCYTFNGKVSYECTHSLNYKPLAVKSYFMRTFLCVVFTEVIPEPSCKWLKPEVGLVLPGNDRRVLYNMDRDSCRIACEEERVFFCLGADFHTGGTCYLHSVNRRNRRLTAHAAFEYQERDCSGEVSGNYDLLTEESYLSLHVLIGVCCDAMRTMLGIYHRQCWNNHEGFCTSITETFLLFLSNYNVDITCDIKPVQDTFSRSDITSPLHCCTLVSPPYFRDNVFSNLWGNITKLILP